MNILFETSRIRKIPLRNRFVRSATCDGMAQTSGHVSSSQIKLIADLAAGGVGLIIHAITYVHPSGQVSSFMNSLADDELIPGMKKLTEAVHHGIPLYCVAFSKNTMVPARRQDE